MRAFVVLSLATLLSSSQVQAQATVHAASISSNSNSASSSNNGYEMSKVKSIQARIEAAAPYWDSTSKTYVSIYGDTLLQRYDNVLDSVNTASVEGALMYVQAEGINVNEQSVKCQRKNNMQYVVFYEMNIVQPTYSIAYYGKDKYTPEYCPFVAMDGAKCTDAGDDLPIPCKQYNGLNGELDLGPCVGANLQDSDPRAPYPGNYWFSFPSSCVMELRADKTDECREKYPGGLCALGVEPDGVNCTFSYKILGYSNIDDIVGITSMTDSLGNYYTNYTEFCEDGGVEFSATNTGSGFKVKKSLPFWKDPGNETANTGRFEAMVSLYNEMAPSASVGKMSQLPSVQALSEANPPCYMNSPLCAKAQYGCKRELYAQICTVCSSADADCVTAPSDFTFPTLSLPKVKSIAKNSSSSSGSDASGSTGTLSKHSTVGTDTSGSVANPLVKALADSAAGSHITTSFVSTIVAMVVMAMMIV